MTVTSLREFDGVRSVAMTRIGASVFCWRDGGASFEFDAGTFAHNSMRFLEEHFAAELDEYLVTRRSAAWL